MSITRTPRLSLDVRGDVGGFDAGSDKVSNFLAGLTYKMKLDKFHGKLFGGYRFMSQEYEDGTGINKSEIDVDYQGPLFGFAFFF